MTMSKIYPSDPHLTAEEIEQLRDWSVFVAAELEKRRGQPVRVSRGARDFSSAKEALEARKQERGSKFKPTKD